MTTYELIWFIFNVIFIALLWAACKKIKHLKEKVGLVERAYNNTRSNLNEMTDIEEVADFLRFSGRSESEIDEAMAEFRKYLQMRMS